MAVELAQTGDVRSSRRKGIGVRARISLPLLLPVLGLLALSGLLLTQKLAVVAAMQRVTQCRNWLPTPVRSCMKCNVNVAYPAGSWRARAPDRPTTLSLSESVPIPALPPSMRGAAIDIDHSYRRVAFSPANSRPLAMLLRSSAKFGRRSVNSLCRRRQFCLLYCGEHGPSRYGRPSSGGRRSADVARSMATYLSFLQAKELAGQERAVGNAASPLGGSMRIGCVV